MMIKINSFLGKVFKWLKSNRKSATVLAMLLGIGLGTIYYSFFYNRADINNKINGQKVTLITVGDSILGTGGKIETTGEIRSVDQADVKAEYSAPVAGIYVGIGDVVQKGQVLVTLSNADLSAGVAQAEANLQREISRFEDLKQSSTGGTSSYEELVKQQDALVANAYRSLLSDDLEAFVKFAYEIGDPPIITGTYSSDIEGDYIIEMYRSGANSGYSFRLSGLEKGTGTVRTENAVPLGTRGLYVKWPENFMGGPTWVVSIPNKRSPTYSTRLNAYESAKSSRSLTLSQSGSNLKAQEAIVAQAEAALAQAKAQASKTVLRAPVTGSVVTLPVRLGEYVSPGQLVAMIANKNNVQVQAYISSDDLKYISVGDKVMVDNKYQGEIYRVAPAIDPLTQKIEILIEIPKEVSNELIIGEFVKVQIEADIKSLSGLNQEVKQGIFLPLRAVKLDPNQASVFMVGEDNKVVAQKVEIGDINGDQVEILSGIKMGDKIISSVRGLGVGDAVSI